MFKLLRCCDIRYILRSKCGQFICNLTSRRSPVVTHNNDADHEMDDSGFQAGGDDAEHPNTQIADLLESFDEQIHAIFEKRVGAIVEERVGALLEEDDLLALMKRNNNIAYLSERRLYSGA